MLGPHVPDLAALQLLTLVDEAGSLRAAAARTGVSQQAVSARVRGIERQVGLPLLVRTTHGSSLTPGGRLLVQWSRKVLEAAAELDAGLASLRTDRQAHLRLAASLTVAEQLLPGWLIALQHQQLATRQRPTDVRLDATNSERVGLLVAAGDVDLGFVEGPRVPGGLRSRVVARDRLLVVVPPGHPWARRRRPLDVAELASTPLVARESGSGTRRAYERAVETAIGLAPAPPAAELSSAAAVRASVVAGLAPAVLSSLAVADDLDVGRLVAVPVGGLDMSRRLRAVWREGAAPPAGPARALVALAAASA